MGYQAGTISGCYSVGSVNVTGSVSSSNSCAGGLVGMQAAGTITNCFSMSSVNCSSYYATAGGLVGYCRATIEKCYSTGQAAVTGTICARGGLVAETDPFSSSINNSFWDTETSGLLGSWGGTGKTTAEMQTQSTFILAGWNFVNTWVMPANNYPQLTGFSFIAIPDVTGMTQAAAQAALTSADFTVGSIALFYDAVVPAGSVISQSPSAGTSTVPGAAIHLVISQGPCPYSGGVGTMANPIQIAAKTDLLTLAANTGDYNKYFIVMSDIDLEGQVFTAAIIGPDTSPDNGYQGTTFEGSFDGNGHIISNFTINGGVNIVYLGLFGSLSAGGSIRDVGLENYTIQGNGQSSFVGSLVGKNYGSITQCFTQGTVTNTAMATGGLVGDSAGIISNCYSRAAVSGTGSYIGGLVGMNYFGGTITNCYSTGFAGGLVGFSNGGITNNSFWKSQVSGQIGSGGGISKTTAEMQTLSTFTTAGWDFTNIWDICEGTNYPRLAWQIPAGDFACPDGVNTEDLDYLAGRWLMENCTSVIIIATGRTSIFPEG